MLIVGNSRGELWVVKNGVATGPEGRRVEVPWVEEGIHYGSAIVKKGEVYKPDGSLVGSFNFVAIPYGLYGNDFVKPRFGVFVLGEKAYVVELESWRPVKTLECLEKWDFMPSYPFADEKSIYCTDGFVVVVTPAEYRVVSAPCGSSFHVDYLTPGRAVVSDIVATEEGFSIVLKGFTLDGGFMGVKMLELEEATTVEPLSWDPLVLYVGEEYVVWHGARRRVQKPFFISRKGLIVGDTLEGKLKLRCSPLYVHGDYYLCGDVVEKLPDY